MTRRLSLGALIPMSAVIIVSLLFIGAAVAGARPHHVDPVASDKQAMLEANEYAEARDEFVWNATIAEHEREWYAGAQEYAAWLEEQERIAATEAQEAAEAQAAAEAAQVTSVPTATATYGSGACGGSLPPCSVMQCESGGSLTIVNSSSGAAGKWQVLPSTWNGYGGYASAADAPESVQDAFAAQLYAGGAGAGHWVCS